MKTVKKMLALMTTLVMVITMMLATGLTAFAADGQGTLTIYNATKGQTYNAYKVFSAVYTDPSDTSKGVVYTVSDDNKALITDDSPFEVGTAKASNGEFIVNVKTDADDEDILTWVKEKAESFDDAHPLTFDDTNSTASATLDYGYYYVKSSLGAVVSIDSVNNAVTIVDKNESNPEAPEKVITAETSSVNASLNQTGISLNNNDAAVGSKESFKVTFNAVNWVQAADDDTTTGSGSTGDKTKVTVYNFTDTPVGLDIDKNTVEVKVNGTPVTLGEDNITKAENGTLSITIPWVDANGNSLYVAKTTGSALIPVEVTYDATVTSAAAKSVAINTVDVKYNTTKDLGTDTTSTYTYKFDLKKTDGTNALKGAKFNLVYKGTTNPLKFDVSEDGMTYTYNPNGSVTEIAPIGENATASIIGLDNADYTLIETVVPDGYTKAADQDVSNLSRVDVASSVTTAEVVNQKGTVLPGTGGIGTTIFYILGSALVIGCGIVLISRKRMQNK